MDRVNLLQEYLCALDEGMGTAYERYALNRFLNELIERYDIKSVVEVPANGVMGVPGLKSMICAMAGCDVTLVNPSQKVIDDMKTLWDAMKLKAKFVCAPYDETGLPDAHADLVWNFCVYEHFTDSAKVVAEMARISSRYVLVEIQNIHNIGVHAHRLYHKIRSEKWDHGEIEKMRLADLRKDMAHAGLAELEMGATDMPPWPDINIRLKDLGSTIKALDKNDPAAHLRPACNPKPISQVVGDWGPIGKNPNLQSWMSVLKLWYHIIELNTPTSIKMLYAHHPYVLAEKKQKTVKLHTSKKSLSEQEDVHFRLKDKFLPGR